MFITPLRPVPAAPGGPDTVAAIVVQVGDDEPDAAALSVLAAGLADEVRRLLEDRGRGTAAVAISGPVPPPAVPPGAIQVDRDTRQATVAGRPLELSFREFELLAFLAEYPGRVFSRRQLLNSVWGGAPVGSRTVDVHVRRLRIKLGAEAGRLHTIRNVGYWLEPDGHVESVATVARAG